MLLNRLPSDQQWRCTLCGYVNTLASQSSTSPSSSDARAAMGCTTYDHISTPSHSSKSGPSSSASTSSSPISSMSSPSIPNPKLNSLTSTFDNDDNAIVANRLRSGSPASEAYIFLVDLNTSERDYEALQNVLCDFVDGLADTVHVGLIAFASSVAEEGTQAHVLPGHMSPTVEDLDFALGNHT